MLRLLLLSDIHYLCMAAEHDVHFNVRKAFLQDICDYAGSRGPIDHILISGDIANHGKKEEFEAAKNFFDEICDNAGCSSEEVYVVPGNHDKDFTVKDFPTEHILNAGLSCPVKGNGSPENLFYNMLEKDTSSVYSLYKPFKSYMEFAYGLDSIEPLMLKFLNNEGAVQYDKSNDKAYYIKQLTTLGRYDVKLYGMNSSINCDWYDEDDFGNGHKMFLPKLAYNADVDTYNCINISMMHHPTDKLVYGDDIAKVLDGKFQIQIFGHLHKPSSSVNNAIHIHSGALQPPDSNEDYFSVYNIIEIEVLPSDNSDDKLKFKLQVQKYDKGSLCFKTDKADSNEYTISLKTHVNRWENRSSSTNQKLPDGITERAVRLKFLKMPNQKVFINKYSHYNDDKSLYENCIDFLNTVDKENIIADLWNDIK